MERITTKGLCFTDEKGRTRIFNGMNMDDKEIRDTYLHNLDDEFFEKYRANGFNLIRLAIQWANLEPQPGQYSESYLKSIDEVFARAEKYGVYILIDMHQDLYSGFDGVGGGDGAPAWACMMDGHKAKPYKFVWAEAYFFGKWVHSCFDHFWHNDEVCGKGLQDHYADLWRMMAKRYGDCPALFGFDLMNEPAAGSLAKKIFLKLVASGAREIIFSRKISRGRIIGGLINRDFKKMLDSIPGDIIPDITRRLDSLEEYFDTTYYAPFISKVATAIRGETDKGIILMEQPYFCNSGIKFSAPPIMVNGKREENQAFGPHGYDVTVDTPLYKYANASRVKAFFSEMRNSQMRLEVPTIVGEWGGCSDNTDTSWFPHAYELLDYFNENQWGQLYWDFHGDDMDAPLMQMLSRTYPVAVAGRLISYSVSNDRKEFTLKYESDGKGETLIYVHKPSAVSGDVKSKTVESYKNGASLISIKAAKGEQTVTLLSEE
ncbi:MAG: cellulase family glycosylhydrolase [Clostridiales bacterium]|nr:cellulase family glycosylhydrolase [Clostridiales bacterium]